MTPHLATVVLRRGRERSLERRHPWVFSGAIERVEGDPEPGATVDIRASDGRWLARAGWSPASQIRARVWTFADEPVDDGFLRRRLSAAIEARQGLEGDTCRLVHGESDGLPGLIVDRYGDVIVVQCLTVACEPRRQVVAEILAELTGAGRVWERSDADARALEGLEPRVGPLVGDPPPAGLIVGDGDLRFEVDLHRGHKTGSYLDQRLNRRRVGEIARARRVLDCFCYSGGFTAHALAGGATAVTAVDASAGALGLARTNLELNGFADGRAELVRGNVFEVLRSLRDRGACFDLIVLDPPKFAATAAQRERAARGYKDINLLAFKLLAPGGLLATFSCSGGVGPELFQRIIAGAALDAGVDAQIIERMTQAPDHPVLLSFPEGEYLKGLVCRVAS